MASNLTVERLRNALKGDDNRPFDVFAVLRSIATLANGTDTRKVAREMVIRALHRRADFEGYEELLNSLARAVGLYPYIDEETASVRDSIALEMFRPAGEEVEELVFHTDQASVYSELLAGRNMVLSAPTSFGKSLIIDAIVATRRFDNIAVVVPSIALIEETRQRLARFHDYKLITHPGQRPATKNIYVMTQERLVALETIPKIDFFVIDEFYKLSPATGGKKPDERAYLLNQAFYLLSKTGAQFYMLGPNITEIPAQFVDRTECTFRKSEFATVVSELHRLSPRPSKEAALIELLATIDGPTIVYCSTPKSARDLALTLSRSLPRHEVPAGVLGLVEWASKHYHPKWSFVQALRHGIALHHGRIPRALGQLAIDAFNSGEATSLVCTSTLIEGVNTKAKNIVVFDHNIAGKQRLDHFTFNNIRGRSGRMFKHFIGRIYVFESPPQEPLPFVEIPVVTQPQGTPLDVLVQIDRDDLSAYSRQALEPISTQRDLPLEVIRANRGVDPTAQIQAAKDLATRFRSLWPHLSWRRQPTGGQLKVVCELLWKHFLSAYRDSVVRSEKQLAFRIERVRHNPGPSGTIRAHIQESGSEAPDEAVESALDFLRNWCMFRVPKYLGALDRIQKHVFTQKGMPPGDFTYFTEYVSSLGVDPALVALDEYGLPLEVGMRLKPVLDPGGDLDLALDRLRALDLRVLSRSGLSDFERGLVERAKRTL